MSRDRGKALLAPLPGLISKFRGVTRYLVRFLNLDALKLNNYLPELREFSFLSIFNFNLSLSYAKDHFELRINEFFSQTI